MVKTIGNPLSWSGESAIGTGRWLARAVAALGGEQGVDIRVNRLTTADIHHALRCGIGDFAAMRTDVIFLVLAYPLIGIVLSALIFHLQLLPLLFPVVAGFALLGPIAATGLYAMSKHRDGPKREKSVGWQHALSVFAPEILGPVAVLGGYLVALEAIWLTVANAVYARTLGPEAPESIQAFLHDVFATAPGWNLIIVGTLAGFVFALIVLVTTLVSIPMLVDRRVGIPRAVAASIQVSRRNPRVVAIWGLIVALLLFLGSLPLFLGLVIVLPVLGHATWHLYRRAVTFEA